MPYRLRYGSLHQSANFADFRHGYPVHSLPNQQLPVKINGIIDTQSRKNMPTFTAHQLFQLSKSILQASGAPQDIAQTVADSLINTNLHGHDSHGIILLVKYLRVIRNGDLIPTARPDIGKREGGTATVDGKWGFGQLTANFGVELACQIASETGIACVSLTRANHIGRLGAYAGKIAGQGYIGLVLTSGSMSGAHVAPYGGRERRFATNPIAWGLPVGEGKIPLISDFATSAYSLGKVGVIERKGEQLPDGIIIDADGNPTNDPTQLATGGALLPFGSYKGFGLSMIIDIITATLSGFPPVSSKNFQQGNPTLMMAIDVERYTSRANFTAMVQEVMEHVKATELAPGFDEILLPGEIEQQTFAKRSAEGIPLSEASWQQLADLATSLGISVGFD